MSGELDLSAESGDQTSAPESVRSNEGFQDAPAKSSGSFFSNPKVKKYAPYIIGGGLLLIVAAVVILKKNASSTTSTNPVDSVAGASGTGADSSTGGSANGGGGTTSVDTTGLQSLLQSQQAADAQQFSSLTSALSVEQQAINDMNSKLGTQNSQLTSLIGGLQTDIGSIQSSLNNHNATGGGSGGTSASKGTTLPNVTKSTGSTSTGGSGSGNGVSTSGNTSTNTSSNPVVNNTKSSPATTAVKTVQSIVPKAITVPSGVNTNPTGADVKRTTTNVVKSSSTSRSAVTNPNQQTFVVGSSSAPHTVTMNDGGTAPAGTPNGTYMGAGKAADVAAGDTVYQVKTATGYVNDVYNSSGKEIAAYAHNTTASPATPKSSSSRYSGGNTSPTWAAPVHAPAPNSNNVKIKTGSARMNMGG